LGDDDDHHPSLLKRSSSSRDQRDLQDTVLRHLHDAMRLSECKILPLLFLCLPLQTFDPSEYLILQEPLGGAGHGPCTVCMLSCRCRSEEPLQTSQDQLDATLVVDTCGLPLFSHMKSLCCNGGPIYITSLLLLLLLLFIYLFGLHAM
jgi:hypothetical protein